MAQLVVEMTSEESKLWQGLQRVISGEGDLEKALQKVVAASKQVGLEYDNNSRFAARMYAATRTPQEQYNASLEKCKILLDGTAKGAELYARATELAKQKLEEAGRAGEKAGESQLKAFGKDQLAALSNMAAGYVTVGKAIEAVSAALEQKEAIERRAKETTIIIAEAQYAAYKVSGAKSTEEQAALTEKLAAIEAKHPTKGLMGDVYQAYTTARQAGADEATAIAAADAATAAERDDAGKQQEAASMAVRTMPLIGAKAPEQALAFLRRGARAAGVPGAGGDSGLVSLLTAREGKGEDAATLAALLATATKATGAHDTNRASPMVTKFLDEIEKAAPFADVYGEQADPVAKRRLELEKSHAEKKMREAALFTPEFKAGQEARDLDSRKLRHRHDEAALQRRRDIERGESDAKAAAVTRAEESPEWLAKMREFEDREKSLPRVLKRPGTGLHGFDEIATYLRAHPQAMAEVQKAIPHGRGEAVGQSLLRIVMGDHHATDKFNEDRTKLRTPLDQQAAEMSGIQATISQAPAQKILAAGQRLDLASQLLTMEPGGQERATAGTYSAANMDKLLGDAGMGSVKRWRARTAFHLSPGSNEQFVRGAVHAESIEQLMGNLAQGEHYKPTAENIRNVERLERGIGAPTEGKDLLQAQILDVLKSLRDGQNASNEHLSALKNHAETQPHKRTLSNPGKDE